MSTTAFASRGSYLGIRAAHKVRAHARFAKLPQELALLAWLAIPIVPCQQVPPRGMSPSHAHDTAEQQTTHQCCRLPLLARSTRMKSAGRNRLYDLRHHISRPGRD